MNNELKELINKISKIENEKDSLSKEINVLNKNKEKLLKVEAKKNIGKCFKRLFNGKPIEYCMIIDIYSPQIFSFPYDSTFKENKYPTIRFDYPFKKYSSEDLDTAVPFYQLEFDYDTLNKKLFDSNDNDYVEISKEEFMQKFNEVNNQWINQINNIK